MRTRAAASSMARGIPSRRWQMAATAGALSLVMAKFGRAARARSLNRRTASEASRDPMSTGPCSSGHGEAGHTPDDLAGYPQRLSGGGQHGQAPATAHQRLRQRRGGGEHVLAVVQHDKGGAVGEPSGERLGVGLVVDLLDAHGGHDGGRDETGVGQARQVHEPGLVLSCPQGFGRYLQGQAGLAAPS